MGLILTGCVRIEHSHWLMPFESIFLLTRVGEVAILWHMDVSPTSLPDDVDRLKHKMLEQQTLLDQHCQIITRKQTRIEQLFELLRLLRQQHFGRRSEKHIDQLELQLFNETELLTSLPEEAQEEPTIRVGAHERKRKPPRALPADLPRVDVIHDLSDAEKHCACGQGLELIGEESSEQLAVIPQQFYVIRHVRLKYACSCQHCIRTASLPAQPLPGSQASAQLLAHTVVSKFHDGLPLYRQEKMAARVGLELARGKLARWLIELTPVLQPLYNLLQETLFGYDIAQTDETGIQVLKEAGREAQSKSYLWIRRGGPPDRPVVLVDYSPSKSGETAYGLLSEFQGYLVSDAASNIQVSVARNALIPVYCNDHARRKFAEVLKSAPNSEKTKHWIASKAMAYYKQLYRIEREIKELSTEQRYQQRQLRAVPIWESFLEWAERVYSAGVAHQRTRKALAYLIGHAKELRRYCDDGRLPISNIRSEHVAKTIAVARKNFLFADTPAGAKASAMLYSMLESAKANGHNTHHYMAVVLTELPLAISVDDIEALLPWNLTPERASQRYAQLPAP